MAATLPNARLSSILVVEDEWITASDLQQTLVALGYRVTALAASADAAIAAIEKECPDLALVDIRLEGPTDGIELAGTIRTRWAFPVVYLTAHSDRDTIERLKKTGPFGYVSKPFDQGQLRAAVELALYNAGQERQRREEAARRTAQLEARTASLEDRLRQIATVLTDARTESVQAADPIPSDLRAVLDSMSRREVEILHLLLANRRVATIAQELSLSAFTVRNHLRSIFRKAGVHSQEELLRAMEPLRRHLQAGQALWPADKT